jgi:hypothetical protein
LRKRELLLLHEIAASLRDWSGGKVLDSQREKLVYYVQKKGSLRNCLAIYGISRDMTKTQEDICVSLELLISELSEEPCKGKIVNNTDYPTLCKVEGRNLQSNFEFMRQLNYSRNVNIQMVFDQYWDFLFQKIQAKRRCRKRYLFWWLRISTGIC